jgi:hypothetical protein
MSDALANADKLLAAPAREDWLTITATFLATRCSNNWAEAESNLKSLSNLGIDLYSITNALQVDGVRSFAEANDRVLDAIAKRSHEPWPRPAGNVANLKPAHHEEWSNEWRKTSNS